MRERPTQLRPVSRAESSPTDAAQIRDRKGEGVKPPCAAQSPRKMSGARRREFLALALLCLFSGFLIFATIPGRMSSDSLTQIAAVRAGKFTDWHSPLLLMTWRPFWLMGFGPTSAYALSVIIFVSGLYGLLRSALPCLWSACATIVVVGAPMVLGYVTYFGRDQWFTASMLASFALVLAISRLEPDRKRLTLSLLLFVALWITLATRQNAAPVVGVALIGWVTWCGPWRRLGRFDRVSGTLGRSVTARFIRLGAATALLAGLIAAQSLVRSAGSVESTHPEQQLYLFDLAALSLRENQLYLDQDFFPAQDVEVLRRSFNPYNASSIVFSVNGAPPLTPPVPADRIAELRSDWLAAIREHPSGYLAFRFEMLRTQVAWENKADWVYHPQIDANPWGYHFVNPDLQQPMDGYLRLFAANDYLQGGWIYEIWVYLLITIAGLGFFASRNPQRKLLALFCVGSLGYQATIFFATMGVGYRLTFPSVVLSLVVVAVGLGDLSGVRTRAKRSWLSLPPGPEVDTEPLDEITSLAAAPPERGSIQLARGLVPRPIE